MALTWPLLVRKAPVQGSWGAQVSFDETDANRSMSRYAKGDNEAFAAVYDALAPRLLMFLTRWFRNAAAAEDALQQTFLRMHDARSRFVPGAPVAPWAFAIARRVSLDARRRTKVEQTYVDPQTHHEAATDVGTSPHALVVAAELEGQLVSAIDGLPEPLREALLLVRDTGLSTRDASLVLGVTEVALRLRVSRAMARLRESLGLEGVS